MSSLRPGTIKSVAKRRTLDFRAIYDTDRASYLAAATGTMGLNVVQVLQEQVGADNEAVTGLNSLAAPYKGWLYMKTFTPSTSGGAFVVTDTKCDAMLASSAGGFTLPNHPRNSHRYNLIDDNQANTIIGYTSGQQDLNLTTIANRRAKILAADPNAICIATTAGTVGNTPQIALFNSAADARIGMTIVDELWLDGYPNKQSGYIAGRIAAQAAAAEAAGKPYCGVIQCFQDTPGGFTYPTQALFQQMWGEWMQTNMRGIVVYVWNNGDSINLSDDSSMQAWLGALMANVT